MGLDWRRANEGIWDWSDGSKWSVSQQQWRSRFPINKSGADCLSVINSVWENDNCYRGKLFICELPTTTMTKEDNIQLVSDTILEDVVEKFPYVACLFTGVCAENDNDCKDHLEVSLIFDLCSL